MPWVVMKFGGTSVSTRASWDTIARQVDLRLSEGLRPLVVCSALAGVSDRLEALVEAALLGEHGPILGELRQRHETLARDLDLTDAGLLEPDLAAMERLATGISLTAECPPRLKARLLATGELLSTRLGAACLVRRGLPVRWWDARELLQAQGSPEETAQRRYLSARCPAAADPALQARMATVEAVHLTQGFIASNSQGETVLLGRGGSDTSAACFGARLEACRVEIWTDVPGMYTADPRRVASARLLRNLDYQEAQELASLGAKVLHPGCLAPLQQAGIPLQIRCTTWPEAEGTRIAPLSGRARAQVKALATRSRVVLISMEGVGMWQQVGFLARVFEVFAHHGLSIDLVATSETNVTVTLDAAANLLEETTLDRLTRDLARLCTPRVTAPCATLSLVGTRIRSALHRLGPALELFEEERVHLVSQASSDLNLTFVVDQDQVERLQGLLHSQLFSGRPDPEVFGPSWQEQFGLARSAGSPREPWWQRRRDELLALARRESPVYAYDRASLVEAAGRLRSLGSVDRVLYSVKANPNPEVLAVFAAEGLGFECVSPGEVTLVRGLFPTLPPERLLYTPNFASSSDYQVGFARGATVTLDNLEPLDSWPEVFRGREVFLRLDLGRGAGHHRHVRTAGNQSKFGIPVEALPDLRRRLDDLGMRATGLHSHSGSGIQTPEAWARAAAALARVAEDLPDVRVLDLGGGLGVPERADQSDFDLAALDRMLTVFRQSQPQFRLWLEPGRYLVARAGVLLARVNQTKRKGDQNFIGVDAGMNSLLRPALYGAYHEIVNLTRLDEPAVLVADVVGPICETGDVLGRDRHLPATHPGDILLVATTGAYGRAMASRYNLREPAAERLL